MECKVKKLTDTAKLPSYGRPGDAALDIYADISVMILGGERAIISTGIAIAVPPDHVGLVWDRSGLAANFGIHTMAGVIDPTYRGELFIVLRNTSQETYQIQQGDRIAQLLIQPASQVAVQEVQELDQTVRNDGKFGSSGR